MQKLFAALFLLLFYSAITGQTRKIKLQVLDENGNPVKNLTINCLPFGESTSTQSGLIEIEVPSKINSIEIAVKDTGWMVVYPIGNILPIPKDENFLSKIFVLFSNKSNENNLEVIANKISSINKTLTGIDSTALEKEKILNQILEKLAKNYDLKKADLLNAIEIEKKQNIIYDEISFQLSNYSLRINNVSSFFGNTNIYAAEDIDALNELVNSINHYNTAFRNLKTQKFNFYNNIKTNWQNSLAAENYLQTVNYLIDEIHLPYLFRLNETIVLLNKINRGFIEEDEIEEAKNNAKAEIEIVVKELNRRLPIVDKKIESLLIALKS